MKTTTTIVDNKEVNSDFIKEFTKKDFKKIEKAILKHFQAYKYTYTDGGNTTPKAFNPSTYEDASNVLGLAYTSSSDCAGLWICNAELSATNTHRFVGFAINTEGKAVGIAWDKDENEILIEL